MIKYLIIYLLIITIGVNQKSELIAKDSLIKKTVKKLFKKNKKLKRESWQKQKTIAGTIHWRDKNQKGYFGEKFTVSLMKKDKNYIEQKIKIKDKEKGQGIDHAYFKINPETKKIDEILIIESKCDTSKLARATNSNPAQMSDEWIKKNLEQLSSQKGNNQSTQISKIILDTMSKNPEKVKKIQFHHNIETGITKKTPIDKNGKLLTDKTETIDESKAMKVELEKFFSEK